MKPKSYTFKPGARLKSKVTPNQVSGELERIRKAKNGLTSRAVVDESKPVDAVLHNEFTWDNKKAADQWRLKEAAEIISCVQVVYETGPKEPQRQYVKLEREPEKSREFAPVDEVLSIQRHRDALILELLRDLQSFRRRFSLVSDLSHVIPVIDDAIGKIEKSIAEA